jgi:hypothetical protein
MLNTSNGGTVETVESDDNIIRIRENNISVGLARIDYNR